MNKEQIEQIEEIIGAWNGEDSHFLHDGVLFTEEEVHKLEDLLEDLNK